MPRYSIHESFTAVMRASDSGRDHIDWGSTASPFYEEGPEGTVTPNSPYCVYTIDDSEKEDTFGVPYRENYALTLHVVALQDAIMECASPNCPNSVLWYLDKIATTPELFDGAYFECIQFQRRGWVVKQDTTLRGPSGERVWIASAVFDIILGARQL